MSSPVPYPVRVEASKDARPSRWLWLVKWLLLVPHLVVLSFLWVAFGVLTVFAFFAILVTGRYPRSVFDFNAGVLRWSWRVNYYGYGALGTDAYPPFTLADVPTYPARLEIDYPEHLSRGLVLVKWWLLAIPHYVVVAVFAGGWFWPSGDDRGLSWLTGGLIAILVLVAAIVLLVTGRYPRPVFDFVLGMQRWVLRVVAYAALMTDRYPPFRMDLGGHDPAGPAAGTGREDWEPAAHRWTGGRVTSVVCGAILAVVATGLVSGGAALLAADRGERDADGFLSVSDTLGSSGYAIVSDRIEISGTPADWAEVESVVGDVRLRATATDAATPVFVGIAPTAAVTAYLDGAPYATLRDWEGGARLDLHQGNRTVATPETAGIWTVRASGPGTQSVVWPRQSGDWTVVVMNADASPGVDVRAELAATMPGLTWIAWSVLGVGLVLFVGGVVLIAVPVHRASPRRLETRS
jgi:hypothetical protein